MMISLGTEHRVENDSFSKKVVLNYYSVLNLSWLNLSSRYLFLKASVIKTESGHTCNWGLLGVYYISLITSLPDFDSIP